MLDTLHKLLPSDFPPIRRQSASTLQVNLGYLCNQQCLHCHVAAGPNRTEIMDDATIDTVIDCLGRMAFETLDLTGGAPELNPSFRRLVDAARALGVHVIDRCNLTVLQEPGQETLAEFLASRQVEIVASLPCYLEDNVDRQRGKGVFGRSITALQRLNRLGYGHDDSGLILKLVFNPQGAELPPSQAALEADYRKMLSDRYGIVFTRLLALANLPIQRFGSTLLSRGEFDDYIDLLKRAHRNDNLAGVMCRSLISVDWQGYLYDCDFNQMLGLGIEQPGRRRTHLRDLPAMAVSGSEIRVGEHCYGCTAGQGSSCGGALAEKA
ncbi:MAG: arsenosugar biosynthesis radical SAM protein ArsS [Gammaproteobacteria bacterium]|nr:arsenosugar biosynthesis radical SAM protein ArsS [Gammaproteobacteria bacterium]